MDMGGVLLREDGAQGNIATLLYVCFPLHHSPAMFFAFDLLDKG